MIEKMGHYSFTNLPSVYDEEALTALELVARLAAKFNEVIDGVNNHEERVQKIEDFLKNELDGYVNTHIVEMIVAMLADGTFDDLVSNGRVRPQMFGATGDGVTDDAEAFTLWATFIADNHYPGYIPNGNYYIGTGTIGFTGKSNFTIEGESRDGVKLIFPLLQNAMPHHLHFNTCNNFTVKNLTIHCSGGDMQTNGCGMNFKDCNHVYVDTIDIENSSRCGVQAYNYYTKQGGRCDNLQFYNVRVYGVENNAYHNDTGQQIYPMGWVLTDVINSVVENCYIENCVHYGYELKNYCRNTYVRNCVARNCGTACHLGGELLDSTPYGVEGCAFENIRCYNVDTPIVGSSFKDCVFDGITAYYTDDFEWVKGANYCVRVQNSANCYYRVSMFNIKYGGIFPSDNSINNVFDIDYVSIADDYAGRIFNTDDTSTQNVVNVKGRAPSINVEYLMARIGENTVIDALSNSFSSGNGSYKSRTLYGVDTPNSTGTTHEAGRALQKTFYSETGTTVLAFGDLSSDYIKLTLDTNNNRIVAQFYQDGALSGSAYLKPTELIFG